MDILKDIAVEVIIDLAKNSTNEQIRFDAAHLLLAIAEIEKSPSEGRYLFPS